MLFNGNYVSLTYIDFNEYCTNKHGEAVTHVTKRVKNGGFHRHVRLVMMMISEMWMTVQHENNSVRECNNKSIFNKTL